MYIIVSYMKIKVRQLHYSSIHTIRYVIPSYWNNTTATIPHYI